MTDSLQILHQDDTIVIINKPEKLLVHRTSISEDTQFALQLLREQLGRFLYPVHRLDRATSGCLLFAFDSDSARTLSDLWNTDAVTKSYLALVRGWIDSTVCDHPLVPIDDSPGHSKKTKNAALPAVTRFSLLARTTVPIPYETFDETRLSFLQAFPQTGRRHQIRRHLKHLAHPIIGDSTYGKGPLNRTLAQFFGVSRLYLHCNSLRFPHPKTGEIIELEAPLTDNFTQTLQRIRFITP